jgi:hypothetical protein
VAPVLLGTLRPIAEALPHGLSLSDVYTDPGAPSHSPSPSDANANAVLPPLLSDVYALRKALVDAKNVPPSCANTIENASDRLSDERSNFQTHYEASVDLRDLAQRRFIAAHIALSTEILLADMKLMERHAKFDRLVLLLRGGSFFADVHFDVDSESFDNYQPYYGWRTSAPSPIFEMLSGMSG